MSSPAADAGGAVGTGGVGHFRDNRGVIEMEWIERCPGADGRTFWRPFFGTPGAPGADGAPTAPVFTPADLVPGVLDAVERQLPVPVPVIAPADRNPNGYAYVQNRTFFWVEQGAGQWATVQATSAVPGLSLTVTAEPERIVVDTGDGGRADCPGAPMELLPDSSPVGVDGCTHVYRNSSATAPNGETFPVTVTIVWHATWTASTGEAGDLGELSTTSPARDLPVAEIQAVITG